MAHKQVTISILFKFGDNGRVSVPAGSDSFEEDASEHLNEEERGTFHKTVAQSSFACERGGPDMGATVSALCSGVQEPGRKEWEKLVQMTKFLHNMQNDVLRLSVGCRSIQSEWFMDALFRSQRTCQSGIQVQAQQGVSCASQQKTEVECQQQCNLQTGWSG